MPSLKSHTTFFAACLLSALALTLSATAPAGARRQQTVTIGAWNIQWLGSASERPGAAKNVAQSPQAVADYIIASGADVLGLEEITDDDGSDSTFTNNTITAALGVIQNRTGQRWRHVLFPKPGGESTQLCGVAWNVERACLADWLFVPVKRNATPADVRSEIWKRHPYAVKFTFGPFMTDVVLIVVHMKSNLGDANLVRRTREWEARLLQAELEGVRNHFHDRDIVILGDTNVLDSSEPAITQYTQAQFRDLFNPARPTTTRAEPFDRIFVSQGQPEFASSQQRVFGGEYMNPRNLTPDQFWVRFSDHFMVTTTVAVRVDDDP